MEHRQIDPKTFLIRLDILFLNTTFIKNPPRWNDYQPNEDCNTFRKQLKVAQNITTQKVGKPEN